LVNGAARITALQRNKRPETSRPVYARIRHNEFEGDDLAGAAPMRDWILILAPIAAIVYFLTYPSEFTALMNWFARLLQ
jgi:hypothetical protein